MKQLLILSGKGGTGKTTLTSAFIKFLNAKAYADCDVDAPNLHLIMQHETLPKASDYFGMPKAVIDGKLCTQCGLCSDYCHFDAVIIHKEYHIDPYACEGCSLCAAICPVNAIKMYPEIAGKLMLYNSESIFSTAELKMGSGTSGKLVSEVKRQLIDHAPITDLAVIDGSPGIGCPVIASIAGVDMVLLVTEPSISGISDLQRIVKTIRHFRVNAAVCINKYDTNLELTDDIETFCKQNHLPFAGKIPFDPAVVRLTNLGSSIADADCPSGKAAKGILDEIMKLM